MLSEANNNGGDNPFENNGTSFAFRPMVESRSSFFLGAASKVISLPSFRKIELIKCVEIPIYKMQIHQATAYYCLLIIFPFQRMVVDSFCLYSSAILSKN